MTKIEKQQAQGKAIHQRDQDRVTQADSIDYTPQTNFSTLVQRVQITPHRLSSADVLTLQRTIGNQATVRLLASQPKLARSEMVADRIRPGYGPEGGDVSPDVAQSIQRARGSGSPMDGEVRRSMEGRFGVDFRNVRVHTGQKADTLNRTLNARAFTTGRDIFFRRGTYQPDSTQGKRLLAHELTHTIQQGGNGLQRAWEGDRLEASQQSSSPGGSSFIQRNISTKSHFFSGAWDQMYATTKDESQDKKQLANDYLTSFDTKVTDRQARKEQKKEASQLKKLLHFKTKDTKTTNNNTRGLFRAILTAERARGQSFIVLAELKKFLIGQGDQIEPLLTGMLNGHKPSLRELVNEATTTGASPDLLNLFYSHHPNFLPNFKNGVAKLVASARPLAAEALQVAGASNKDAVIRLRHLVPQMLRTIDAAEAAAARDDYARGNEILKLGEMLENTVWQLTQYGKIDQKSGYSSDIESGEAKRLGGGQFSKVLEVNYDPFAHTSIQHGVFKQEPRGYDPGDSAGADFSGIATSESNFSGRSVASYQVDELLKIGMTPTTDFATHAGTGGTIQDWAKGQSPQDTTTVDGEATNMKYRDFDYSDPELQRQLATLQLLDAITGQVDRHPGNYYVYQGPGGTRVTAIDNDLAFGKDKDVEQMFNPLWDRKLDSDFGRGVPLFVDESIAEQILSTTAQELKDTISGMLTDEEITKTLARFAKVQTELRRKKSNTARIKMLQRRLDEMDEDMKEHRHGNPQVYEALVDTSEHVRGELANAYAKGALIDRSDWGERTAQHLTYANSYYGLLVENANEYRAQGMLIPVDHDVDDDESDGGFYLDLDEFDLDESQSDGGFLLDLAELGLDEDGLSQ